MTGNIKMLIQGHLQTYIKSYTNEFRISDVGIHLKKAGNKISNVIKRYLIGTKIWH